MSLKELNDQFAIPNHLQFEPGPGGLTVARITNPHASASIALHGGHVLSFTPNGKTDLLWLSRESMYADGEPIRGGIPVCWPWFGAHPTDEALPAHGFARRYSWMLLVQRLLLMVLPGSNSLSSRVTSHLRSGRTLSNWSLM